MFFNCFDVPRKNNRWEKMNTGIKSDIYFYPEYPMYFGIGNKHFNDRVKYIIQEWIEELKNIFKNAVITISIQNINIPKDINGNVNLNVPTLNEFNELSLDVYNKYLELKNMIESDMDELYHYYYTSNNETIHIISKQNFNTI